MLFYLEQSPPAADAFIDEVEAVLTEIAESPERVSHSRVRRSRQGPRDVSLFDLLPRHTRRGSGSIYQPSIQTRRALA